MNITLKRNQSGVLDRLQYDLKQFDIDLAEVMAIENEEDFLARAASRFLDWVYLKEQHRIVAARLSLSEEQRANTQERREANLIDEVDVIRAEDAVRIARQDLYLIESEIGALPAASLWYSNNYIKFILFPSDTADSFVMFVELPTGASLQATSDKTKEIEKLLGALPAEELASYNARIGANYSEMFVMAETENHAALKVRLTPFSELTRTADEIVNELREQVKQIGGVEKIVVFVESGGPPVGKPINVRLIGSDDALRRKLTDSVESWLASNEGVKDISRDDRPGRDQVEIDINYDRLSRLGLTVADVARNVRIAYDGEVITSVRYGDEDTDFRIILHEQARHKLDYLNELPIPNQRGRLIPLKEVARLKAGPGPSNYRHFDGERAVTVEADVDAEVATPVEITGALTCALQRRPGLAGDATDAWW